MTEHVPDCGHDGWQAGCPHCEREHAIATAAMEGRTQLNLTTGDLDVLRRLAEAERELHDIADALFKARSSRRATREDQGRRLNAVAASLRTVVLRLTA